MNKKKIEGTIFSIERSSMYDGPGIRTVVFFKGCPLTCRWCHNPESQSPNAQLAFYEEKCTGCKKCASVCTNQVHYFDTTKHYISFANCIGTGNCTFSCPTGALKRFGYKATPEQIMEIVRKDMSFYNQTGGGLTITGGEPFFQSEFLIEVLKLAKLEGIHTCVETCGFVPTDRLIKALPYTDLFLFDYKETSPSLHKEFTGVDNRLILNNLDLLYQLNKPIILRCPIIPGFNDTKEHFSGIHKMEKRYHNLVGIEIMPYHDLGKEKAIAIGHSYDILAHTADEHTKEHWKQQMADCGCTEAILKSF